MPLPARHGVDGGHPHHHHEGEEGGVAHHVGVRDAEVGDARGMADDGEGDLRSHEHEGSEEKRPEDPDQRGAVPGAGVRRLRWSGAAHHGCGWHFVRRTYRIGNLFYRRHVGACTMDACTMDGRASAPARRRAARDTWPHFQDITVDLRSGNRPTLTGWAPCGYPQSRRVDPNAQCPAVGQLSESISTLNTSSFVVGTRGVKAVLFPAFHFDRRL